MFRKITHIFLSLLFISPVLWAKPIEIVAAENFYGGIAKEIGGPYVNVLSVMNNPNQDPHLFSSTPTIARAISQADLIIYNGIDYDTWMENLIKPISAQNKTIIVVAKLLNKQAGDNPHIWYDPSTMMAYATVLVEKLSQLDPEHEAYFEKQFTQFKQQYHQLLERIAEFKQAYQGAAVIATEPVFDYMASALGLVMHGQDFQLSMMNGVGPSAKDTQDFENKLDKHLVKLLIYNDQVTNPTVERLKDLAIKLNVPVVGVSEVQPSNQTYFGWMNAEIDALQKGLLK